jgi:P27 family predicted phage terminase small subunit
MRPRRPELPPAPEPPEHLSSRSRELWQAIVPRRGRSPGRLALLQTGLEALDRVYECREILKREGLTVQTKRTGVVHAHPLVKVEKEQRQLFMRSWSQLGLGWDEGIDSGLDFVLRGRGR